MNLRDAAPIVGVMSAVAADHFPAWEPFWIATLAFVTGMAIHAWWIDEVRNGNGRSPGSRR